MSSQSSSTNVLEKEDLKHAPGASNLAEEANKQLCEVQVLNIPVSSSDGIKSVEGFLHTPQKKSSPSSGYTAAILVSGASGGVVGPSSMYLGIADKLASPKHGLPVLRLNYRYPARNKQCVPDILAAMSYLQTTSAISRFMLVGWSYGGAPVFTIGGQDDRIIGCATIASQTAETDGIVGVARRNVPTLLLHGTRDRRLSPACSQSLCERYKRHSSEGQCKLKLFDGDDHSLTNSSLEAEELICDFILKQAGIPREETEHESVLQKPLVGQQDKIEKVKLSGDLQGESID